MNQANLHLDWIAPDEPADESERVATLCAMNVLDGPPSPELDRITRLAARLFEVPIALVSLIDSKRQWFLSKFGLDAPETGRDISFCGHAILGQGPMVIADARLDPRFANNPLVTGGPLIRFYAGQPIRSKDGHALGTLCMIDRKPRYLAAPDLIALNDFALMAEQYFHALESESLAKAFQFCYTRSETLLNNTFAQAAVGMALLSFDGHWLQVNQRLCDMLGYNESTLLKMRFQDITHADDLSSDLELVQQLKAGAIDTYTLEKRYRHADGNIVWGELTVSMMRDHLDKPLHFLSVINEITARKKTESALNALRAELEQRVQMRTIELENAVIKVRQERDRGQLLMHQLEVAKEQAEANANRFINAAESHLDAYFMLRSVRDADGVIVDFRFEYLNKVGQAMLKRPRDAIIGHLISELLPFLHEQGFLDKFRHTVAGGQPLAEQFRLDADYLDARWIYHEVVKIGDGISISATDITERKRAEESLMLKEAMLRQVTDSIPAVVAFVDAGQRYRYCNLAYFQSFDATSQQIIDHTILEFIGAEQYAVLEPYIVRALAGETVEFDHARLKEGQLRQFEVHYLPQLEAENRVAGFYIVGWDVTGQRQRENSLRDRVTLDAMTGLLNRVAFMELVEARLQQSPPTTMGLAMLFLDIDHFKQVNDRFGHAAGDTLIKEFGARVRAAVRHADIVARLGGDEFVVLLPQIASLRDAEMVADKIRGAMLLPATLPDGQRYTISSSIGVAYADAGAALRLSAAKLLASADESLYQAKAAGRDCWRSRTVE